MAKVVFFPLHKNQLIFGLCFDWFITSLNDLHGTIPFQCACMHDPNKMLVGLSTEEVRVLATEMMLAEGDIARQWQHVLAHDYTTDEDNRGVQARS